MKMLRVSTVGLVLLTGTSGMIIGQRGGGGGTSNRPPLQDPQRSPMPGPMSFPSIDGRDSGIDPLGPRLAEQQARSRNNERQKKLVADTDKLLALVRDLKQQMDKSDKAVQSMDVVKKTEEIEKLAKSVKDRMKG